MFNAAFDPALLAYGSDYDNSQTFSAAFESYVDDLVAYLLRDRGVREARIVEVGCGKGTFLRKLVADQAAGNQVVWDFFYEHCSLFSGTSLAWTFRRAGFEVSRVKHVFGGQYLWLEADWSASRSRAADSRAAAADPGALPGLADQFAAAEGAQLAAWTQETRRLRRAGRIALWGAGAKGVTFANLVDPDAQFIDCVVDLNPKKQGKFLPGTGHPLVAPSQLDDNGVSTALVLNSNYVDEIHHTLQALSSAVSVLDLMGTLSV